MGAADLPSPPAWPELDELDKRLLNEFQRGFPVCSHPYAEMATRVNSEEATVIERLGRLKSQGFISRVGPVFHPGRVGASTLAVMAVPEERLASVAELVNGYPEVNHNYEREHAFNLWFVVTAASRRDVAAVLDDIRRRTELHVMDLPLEEEFFIDLGFPLWPTSTTA